MIFQSGFRKLYQWKKEELYILTLAAHIENHFFYKSTSFIN